MIMFSKTSKAIRGAADTAVGLYKGCSDNHKAILNTAVLMAVLAVPELAFAQQSSTVDPGSGINFFCYIAKYFKAIVGTAALVTIGMWAIEHIFGAAKLHDVVVKVGITSAIVIGATSIITGSSLTTSCVI